MLPFDLVNIKNVYFPSIYHYNSYFIGLIGAWMIKNEIKPKFLDSTLLKYFTEFFCFFSPVSFLFYLDSIEKSGDKLNFYLELLLPVFIKFVNVILIFWLFYAGCLNYNRKFK